MRYLLHATTRDGHYLGHVQTVGALPTLAVAAVASAWLRGLRFEIESPVRPPVRTNA